MLKINGVVVGPDALPRSFTNIDKVNVNIRPMNDPRFFNICDDIESAVTALHEEGVQTPDYWYAYDRLTFIEQAVTELRSILDFHKPQRK